MTEAALPTGSDSGAIFDAHVRAEFVERDMKATMATMSESPYVTHVPVLTGGYGREQVQQFYSRYFIGRWAADTEIAPVSRTSGQGRVIDELIMRFTHDVAMPALLPGVPPTGRKVELPFVVVMGIEDGKVHLRAHLLGPGLAPGAGRPAQFCDAAGQRRRAGTQAP
jgi:carboxymethylenebutenolidase